MFPLQTAEEGAVMSLCGFALRYSVGGARDQMRYTTYTDLVVLPLLKSERLEREWLILLWVYEWFDFRRASTVTDYRKTPDPRETAVKYTVQKLIYFLFIIVWTFDEAAHTAKG